MYPYQAQQNATATPCVLIVDDDAAMTERLVALAQREGWRVETAQTQPLAFDKARQGGFDLLILDRMLNDGSGDALALVNQLRHLEVATPVIVLSSIGGSLERTRGLRSGADMYLEKPFQDLELVAAATALFRRHGIGNFNGAVFEYGGLELRLHSRTASWQGVPVRLAPKSFEILELLARHRGACVSRRAIWAEIWPTWRGEPQMAIMDQAIFRLRQELGKAENGPCVVTVRSRGFRLDTRP